MMGSKVTLNNYRAFAAALFCLFVAGCSTVPSSTKSYSEVSLDRATKEAKSGDWEYAYKELLAALAAQPDGAQSFPGASTLISQYPQIISVGMKSALQERVANARNFCTESTFDALSFELGNLERFQIAVAEAKDTMRAMQVDVLSVCVPRENGYTLKTVYAYPDLFSEAQKRTIYDKQKEKIQESVSYLTDDVTKYCNDEGLDVRSELGPVIESTDWYMYPSARDWVRRNIPSLVAEGVNKADISVRIKCVSDAAGVCQGVKSELQKYKNINIASTDSPESYEILVERTQFQQTSIPPHTEQVYVDYWAMDRAVAVLFYPKGSTAVYDRTTGGSSLDYAFNVALKKAGKEIYSDSVSGSERAEYKSASNLRYINVFGGVGVPDSFPNAQVKAEFANSSKSADPSKLESRVRERVVNAVTELPVVKAAIAAGYLEEGN